MDTTTDLLLRLGTGDRDALEEFVVAMQPDVWRFCSTMVGRAEADDATQETLIRAWRSAGGFRGESSARTWTLTIARRVCLALITRRGRVPVPTDRLPEPSETASAEGRVAIEELVRGLEPDRRAAFFLTQMLGFSYQDAAAVCDCPVGTVRSRVARARFDLVSALQESPVGQAGGDH